MPELILIKTFTPYKLGAFNDNTKIGLLLLPSITN